MLNETWFGRCIFLSWYCEKGTCKFCFRSTQKHKIRHAKSAKRTQASIMVDAILGKHLGWRMEFLTGGYKIFSFDEILDIIKKVSYIYESKIWVNLGVLDEKQLEQMKPYVEGICASIETVNENLHDQICPDKPIKPYSEMLKSIKGFKKSITIIIGLGETEEDFSLLKDFISEHELDRITFYALKPVQGTPYTKSPDIKYYSWWIKETRKHFPELEIITGLTPRHPEYAYDLLISGANAITKFPVLKKFNTDETRLIEELVRKAGRRFLSSLNKLPDVDWAGYVKNLDNQLFDFKLKEEIKLKLENYTKKMV